MEMIPNVNYFDEEIFLNEEKFIFQNSWLFACLKSELPNKSDYITLEVGNRSVIIYNNGEEIKAFQNLCPHRFYRIFTKKNGNASLTCGFHNWCFNGKGQNLSSIFKGKDDLKNKFSLKSYPIEFIGDFIFFNFNESPSLTLFYQP